MERVNKKNDLNSPRSCREAESLEFVRLLTTHQHRIYAYILTLVPDWFVAEDILQDVTMVMWTKYPTVRPVDNFIAWAIRIAHNKILNYLTKNNKQTVFFNSDVLEDVARQTEQVCSQIDDRVTALKHCMSKLTQVERQYLQLRYEDRKTIKEVACEVNKPIQGMYKKMARIHNRLMQCIQHRLTPEGGA